MEEIRITYIDDNMDLELQKYFDKKYHNQNYNIIFKSKKFELNIGYEELINDEKVRNANIIIIDLRTRMQIVENLLVKSLNLF